MTNDYKNIIFDFGGVIIHIDFKNAVNAFAQLQLKNFNELYSHASQHNLFDDFEKGKISPADFRNSIREISKLNLTDEQIDASWNALIGDLPDENIKLLVKLKTRYRLFLLSNTNAIHEKSFTQTIMNTYGENILKNIFEKVYFSFNMNMRKPDLEIFLHVLKENNLLPAETLFVDDSPQHIEGAKRAGLQTLFLEKGMRITEVF